MPDSLIQLVDLPVISDDCQLIVAQSPHIPFAIARVYYMLDFQPNLPRGYHAHKLTDQILFCVQGSARIIVDDGQRREESILAAPQQGIFLPKMLWHEMHDLTSSTVMMVLASRVYEAEDYIRDYDQFKRLAVKEAA